MSRFGGSDGQKYQKKDNIGPLEEILLPLQGHSAVK
jgi:hypothetical protein